MVVRLFLSLFAVFLLVSCEGPEPRRPKKVRSGSYYKESIERSQKLLAKEQQWIQDIVRKDTLHHYRSSSSGSWYYYDRKNDTSSYVPRPDDLVTLTYNVVSFGNDTLYSSEEIGIQRYKVDKQELFPGLRHSVKILKEGEIATFLFPSSLGYGYPGDGDRIGVNVPIKSTLELLKIERTSTSGPSLKQDNINPKQ